MTSPDMQDNLPPPDVLDSWAVPPPPPDLISRTMAAFEETQMDVRTPDPDAWPAQAANRRPVSFWIAVSAAVIAVAALAAAVGGREREAPSAVSVAAAPQPATPATAPTPAPVPAPEAAAQQTAAIVITTDPVDATVRLDGVQLTGPTPHVAGTTALGRHHVSVQREGYVPFERDVDLGDGGLQLPVALQRAATDSKPLKSPFAGSASRRDLKNPFDKGGKPNSSAKPKGKLKSPFNSPKLEDPFQAQGE